MLLVHGLRLPLGQGEQQAHAAALRKTGLKENQVAAFHLHRVSVDARHRAPLLVYSVALQLKNPAREEAFAQKGPDIQLVAPSPATPRPGTQRLPGPVIVCGLGPAGLFAALALAEAGFAPLVLERGPAMDIRMAAVRAFETGGAFDPNANIQFGEGGAGTFSDGKLATRIRDPLCAEVTRRLLEAGAPEEIAWRARPHIGTDRLRGVFVALRQKLVEAGARVSFDTKLLGLDTAGDGLRGIKTPQGALPCGVLVLAPGHSARDTFTMLDTAGVTLRPKPFSVGVRIEHLQRDIDAGLYHAAAGHPDLPPGEYRLSCRQGGRGVYTFCMCPGGSVVAAASEEGGVVTNGMSNHARSGQNANAALVAGVDENDFGPGLFGGVDFQRQLERAAFRAGGSSYAAPAETAGSFMQSTGRLELGRVQPSYPRGVAAANLAALLPAGIAQALRGGLADFGRKLPGFNAADAVLTGLETRTSSPLRIVRGENGESVSTPGLYPAGEGAGYAGGIMSAAVDGLRAAYAIIERYAPGG